MSLLRLVRPINKAHQKQLETKMKLEQARLRKATDALTEVLREDLEGVDLKSLVRERPFELAIAFLLGGLVLAKLTKPSV